MTTPTPEPKKKLLILVVEDDERRTKWIEPRLPDDFRMVWCANAGAALGLLDRSEKYDFAGVMLDFDLEKNNYVRGGEQLTGGDVSRRLAERLSPDTLILVHSMNPIERGEMVGLLRGNGFDVLHVPFTHLDEIRFTAWLDEVRENYSPE